jgi:hypothetical protein
MRSSVDAAAAELLELAAQDVRTREALVRTGELFDGYHPRMAAVHRANAERLRAIVKAMGWPTPGALRAGGPARVTHGRHRRDPGHRVA